MGLPDSKSFVANMAMDYVGQSSVSDIDNPTTPTEIIVARHYDNIRRQVLRMVCPHFALAPGVCSRSGTPDFDYSDKYQLPDDFVKLSRIGEKGSELYGADYKIYGRELYINASGASSIKIEYIKDETEVTKWDADFIKVVALFLAEATAYQITKKQSVVAGISALIRQELPDLLSAKGQERPPTRYEISPWIDGARNNLDSSVAGKFTEVP